MTPFAANTGHSPYPLPADPTLAAALDLDPDRALYTALGNLATATEKARRDAPAIAVCEVGGGRPAIPVEAIGNVLVPGLALAPGRHAIIAVVVLGLWVGLA